MFALIAELRLRDPMPLRLYVLEALCPAPFCLSPYVADRKERPLTFCLSSYVTAL